MRRQGGGPDYRLQSRLPVRAVLPREQDHGHAGAEDRGLASTDRRNDPEGHAGVCETFLFCFVLTVLGSCRIFSGQSRAP